MFNPDLVVPQLSTPGSCQRENTHKRTANQQRPFHQILLGCLWEVSGDKGRFYRHQLSKSGLYFIYPVQYSECTLILSLADSYGFNVKGILCNIYSKNKSIHIHFFTRRFFCASHPVHIRFCRPTEVRFCHFRSVLCRKSAAPPGANLWHKPTPLLSPCKSMTPSRCKSWY